MIAINEILNELGRDCVSNCAFRWLEDATNAYTMMNYYFGNLKPHNERFFSKWLLLSGVSFYCHINIVLVKL